MNFLLRSSIETLPLICKRMLTFAFLKLMISGHRQYCVIFARGCSLDITSSWPVTIVHSKMTILTCEL